MTTNVQGRATELVDFWRASKQHWFERSDRFDAEFSQRFAGLHALAADGAIVPHDATSALALVILLDQYPRNAFRGTPRVYSTDALARDAAAASIEKGWDREVDHELRDFFYLPFQHSESLADQQRSLELHRAWDPAQARWAEHHHGIVQRFGRFPHRNAILGRPSTQAELDYLAAGGFSG